MEEHIKQSTNMHMVYMLEALKAKDVEIAASKVKIEEQSQKIEHLEERIDAMWKSKEECGEIVSEDELHFNNYIGDIDSDSDSDIGVMINGLIKTAVENRRTVTEN